MRNKLNINRSKIGTFKYKCLATLILTGILSACDNSSNPTEATVNYVLASVDGGSCALFDPNSNFTQVADTAITSEGVGIFEDVPADTGLVVVECSGGTYIDEATGEELTADFLRSYVDITSSEFTVTVSPLTELAARLVEYYQLAPETYFDVLENVAFSFGLKDVDLATVVPLDLNVYYMDGSENGNYGLVLAALSQYQLDVEADSAEEVIQELFVGMANNGLFTNDEIRDVYFYALENMFFNPRIDPYLGSDEDLDKFFHDVVQAPLVSQVEYIDASHPDSNNLQALSTIDAFSPSVFELVGTHMSLKLGVTLGGEACKTYDLQTLSDTNTDSKYTLMYAECPEQAIGESDLVVMDNDRVENTVTMTVVDPGTWDYALEQYKKFPDAKMSTYSVEQKAVTGSSWVFGTIKGEAPAIDPSTSPAHDYYSDSLAIFNISGVTVELVDESDSVIASTTTYPDGYYEFGNVPESTSLKVVAKAEIKKVKTDDTGPDYNFSVRDNTSTSSPRAMYQIATPYFTTYAEAGSDNEHNLVAKIGFDSNGQALSDEQRESAPFAILRAMKSGADALEQINPNINMPPLVIYWSPKNIGTDGDKASGQIGTSHYSGQGLAPGLYILGKADSDTDEFDQGVIGHEFGHYLQDQLSYSDSPGDSHGDLEYKDASLAYGEGYGTAIGGLLSGSQYYCDVSGENQLDGFCTDLTDKNEAGYVNGFYSEASIITLMYGIGKLPGKGLTEFFNAFTEMKTSIHSATIFSFLHHYLKANPDVTSEVQALMADANIKSSDPYGVLPEGTAADPAISAANNKKTAAVGADDLERLYIELELESIDTPTFDETPPLLTTSAPTFCLNRNLQGANGSNGLGMSKRFTFTSNYTGNLLLQSIDKYGETISDQNIGFEMRDETGSKVRIWGYNGENSDEYFGGADVKSGTKYSLNLNVSNPEMVLNGSQCGYKVQLAKAAD
ncbi:hypothetical protein [Paraglaciecola sp. L3A3]|uniref:hypothetical protein n=1 Tax=Paraglaciecola sp. L3A3 TaxID=2686358 RepID=UPI00131E18D4|nr:hypothetical protein [Paraglaciecola sp. L3A3]